VTDRVEWWCTACEARGSMPTAAGEAPSVTGRRIMQAHRKATGECADRSGARHVRVLQRLAVAPCVPRSGRSGS